jgi:hypothetical protein
MSLAHRSKALGVVLRGVAASLRGFASQASHLSSNSAPQLPPCDFVPPKYEGPTKEDVLKMRQQYLSPGKVKYYSSNET